MKIAIPVAQGSLCMHFGHCEVFTFFEVDEQQKKIMATDDVTPPAHEPGILPKWIKDQGANVVLAGGMGQRAQQLFRQNGVEVIVGVSENDPKQAVLHYLEGTLKTGANTCDH